MITERHLQHRQRLGDQSAPTGQYAAHHHGLTAAPEHAQAVYTVHAAYKREQGATPARLPAARVARRRPPPGWSPGGARRASGLTIAPAAAAAQPFSDALVESIKRRPAGRSHRVRHGGPLWPATHPGPGAAAAAARAIQMAGLSRGRCTSPPTRTPVCSPTAASLRRPGGRPHTHAASLNRVLGAVRRVFAEETDGHLP
jgi:hypothetical protein